MSVKILQWELRKGELIVNDRLLLNDDKTEVLLIETHHQLNKLDRSSCLRVGDNDIGSVACARNLGVWFDEKMSTDSIFVIV